MNRWLRMNIMCVNINNACGTCNIALLCMVVTDFNECTCAVLTANVLVYQHVELMLPKIRVHHEVVRS